MNKSKYNIWHLGLEAINYCYLVCYGDAATNSFKANEAYRNKYISVNPAMMSKRATFSTKVNYVDSTFKEKEENKYKMNIYKIHAFDRK